MSPTPMVAREATAARDQQEALHGVFGDIEEEHRAFVELRANLREGEVLERPGGEWSAAGPGADRRGKFSTHRTARARETGRR